MNYPGTSYVTKLRMINPYMDDWDRGYWFTASGAMISDIAYVKRAYSVNALLLDKTGAALSGVTVKCYDKDSNLIFSADTDVNGLLAEQIITYKEYRPSTTLTVAHLFTLGRITTYSPFRLEFSKTGLETYTIYHPIDEPLDLVVSMDDKNYKNRIIDSVLYDTTIN